MSFPKFAGQTYMFLLFQGNQTIKQEGIIPASGDFNLTIPKGLIPYTGMARWLLTNSKDGGGLDMIINAQDFSITCNEPLPNNSNIIYKGPSQTPQLNRLNKEQASILNRYAAMQMAVQSFTPNHAQYKMFQQELNEQQHSYRNFHEKASASGQYDQIFLMITNITRGLGPELTEDPKIKANMIAMYIANDLDWNILYTSGHWSTVIDMWTNAHATVIQQPERFIADFVKIGNQLNNKRMYADWAAQVSRSLSQAGKDMLISAVAPYVTGSGKILNYEDDLAAYTKGNPGTLAPDLYFGKDILKATELSKDDYKKTLLLFYDSECGHCERVLHQIPLLYSNFKDKKVRIVSISEDRDEEVYKSKLQNFLWKDHYHDTGSINSRNYGIGGMPTLVLIDNQGKILLKTASIEEVMIKI
ncbi:thioredoxin family protein [Chryseobacterium sp. Leaf201]|uniref:thioredoxin family protein n=1 Tax=Chryseobacterium sp. Leaf201 TaxID=1735672 RepID=UPI0006F83D45|nr:thioredoxin family protein [Chryseobacterium sp. Leaf201]KQM55243.1 hypothetical protein ASE55_07295 [Chryseobacterium sp. Leaf201]